MHIISLGYKYKFNYKIKNSKRYKRYSGCLFVKKISIRANFWCARCENSETDSTCVILVQHLNGERKSH